jgi:glycosyltransferase involved in cell wall biosynthesis
MSNLIIGKATICIVNYKTPDFIKLCLRSIRKFTTYPYEVIVVDNNSGDASLEYLKSLGWVRLIERDVRINENDRGHAHAAALDLGLENCNTEFYVSMHSDTFVRNDGWLGDLIGYFGGDENIACVGSGKIELMHKWRTLCKRATDLKGLMRKILGERESNGKYRYYNRTICSLYRTDVLRREGLSFLMDREKGLAAGKKLYFELVDRGYKTVELPISVMGRYIYHLAHATQVTNVQEFKLREKTVIKCQRVIDKVLSLEAVQSILNDDSLDN